MTRAEIEQAIERLEDLRRDFDCQSLRLALACLRDYVPREDRQEGYAEAYLAGLAHGWSRREDILQAARQKHANDRDTHKANAHRLLKLERP